MAPNRVSPRDKAVAIYVAALRDVNAPKYCGICLTGLICKILPTPDVYHDVLASHHEFWNVSCAFLTQSRSEEEMETLLRRLSQCDCPKTDSYFLDLHATSARCESDWKDAKGGNLVSQDASYVARARFPRLLMASFSHAVGAAKTKNVAKGAKATWPQTITDLIPLGGETTVDAMIRWHHALENDMIIFALLGVMVRICRTLIMPHIAASALPALMVSSGRALFNRTYAGLDSPNQTERRQCANAFFHQAGPMDSFLLCLLMETIGEVQFARGNETKLVQLCNLLVHISTDPRLPPQRTCDARALLMGCTTWASNSYRLFHMYLPPRPPIVLHPNVAAFDMMSFPPPPAIRDLRETVHTAIAAARRDMRCSALDCPRSLQSAGRDFMRCSRCRVVCYCGKECQTRAWKEERYPHRRLCPILSALVRISNGAATDHAARAAALQKWAQAQVPEDDFQLVHDWFELTHLSADALLPNGTEWRPGFDDYDEVVARFGADGKGPKSFLVNPLARWPSEVAKVKAAHEALPFCGEEIE
ncbi:hypothetical protein B0H10DRAFT_1961418 [Mycena sp. CBHHK59/15]|nr:hypothetical protein B0H10DRAFT_1961418 [Mycena sp. CBHHK59/15]